MVFSSAQNKLFDVVRVLLSDYVSCCNGQFMENWTSLLQGEDAAHSPARKYHLMVRVLFFSS